MSSADTRSVDGGNVLHTGLAWHPRKTVAYLSLTRHGFRDVTMSNRSQAISAGLLAPMPTQTKRSTDSKSEGIQGSSPPCESPSSFRAVALRNVSVLPGERR